MSGSTLLDAGLAPVALVLAVARVFLVAFLTGLAVKLMDDALDVEIDAARGYRNWAARLGRATTPYALVLAFVAATLQTRAALALFLAAYALGMGRNAGEWLPTGLPAWAETALALAFSAVFSGARVAVAALAILWAVQAADDWMDRHEDGRWESPSLRWLPLGRAVLGALLALALDPVLSLCTIPAALAVWTLTRKQEVHEA
ncbi:MAG: hypothetical protein ACM3ZA_00180 [Bacillota bacterium]